MHTKVLWSLGTYHLLTVGEVGRLVIFSLRTCTNTCLIPSLLKHGASLYLKFEGLNLSVVIIFKTFHWLKNFKSFQSSAWLVVSTASRAKTVILCCCETTFLIIAELTYSLTYQIIISPIPSIPDFVYIHFAQNNYLNC